MNQIWVHSACHHSFRSYFMKWNINKISDCRIEQDLTRIIMMNNSLRFYNKELIIKSTEKSIY